MSAKLDLYASERDAVISWTQKTVVTDASEKDEHCVPLKALFKLLRLSNITRAMQELMLALGDTHDSDLKVKTSRKKQKHKKMFTTLDGAMAFCYYVYSRKLYSKTTYERALYCYEYIREIQTQMSDTINCVRDVVVLNGLAPDESKIKNLDTRDVTKIVLEQKSTGKKSVSPQEVLDALRKTFNSK